MDLIEEALEPPVVETKDLVADPRTVPPDQVVAQKDLLELLQHMASTWPKVERETFEPYFVEGFEPEEIGLVLGRSTEAANELLAAVRHRMRAALLEQSAL